MHKENTNMAFYVNVFFAIILTGSSVLLVYIYYQQSRDKSRGKLANQNQKEIIEDYLKVY